MVLFSCFILRDLCHIIVDQQQRPNNEAVEDLFPDIVFSDVIKTEFNNTENMLTKNARESKYRLNSLGDKNLDANPVGLDFEQYLLENGLKKGMFVNSFPTFHLFDTVGEPQDFCYRYNLLLMLIYLSLM